MNITKIILRKIRNKFKTARKTIKEITHVKNNSTMLISSLLMDETITKKSKFIANHFNSFLTSVAAKLNEQTVKAKKQFSNYLGQTDETVLSPTTAGDIESLINCIKPNKAIGYTNKNIN